MADQEKAAAAIVAAVDDEKAKAAAAANGGDGYEAKAFEALERDFQEVMQELSGDKSLERFRGEYEKLHRALRKSHESEKRLIKKCRELNSEIVSNAARVQTALKLSEEDQTTISALRKEIEKAWKMVDASHEKEARAKETIAQLKMEISNLGKLVEAGAGLSIGQEQGRDEAIKERDAGQSAVVSLRAEVSDSAEKLRLAEAERIAAEHDAHSLREQIAARKADAEREQRKKERMEKEMKELRGGLEARQAEIRSKQALVAQGQEQLARYEVLLKEQRAASERAGKEAEALAQKVAKLHADLEEQVHANTQLLAENSQRVVELKVKEEEVSQSLDKSRLDAEKSRDELRGEVAALEREVESARRATETERKKCDELLRERDLLNKMKTQAENQADKERDLVKINENAQRNLEQEVSGYRAEAARQARVVAALEREREKYGAEASDASSKYLAALEEVKLREMTVLELQKRIAEGENRLKQQQNLYEAVRSDRNLYSKNTIEAQDEIQEMKRKFKIMQHQIEQLKEEIAAKDVALVREHLDRVKVEKEKEGLRAEANRATVQIRDAEGAAASQASEIAKLNEVVREADSERMRQKKELDTVMDERDVLGTQLVRRNDELSLLYEKIRIQQSALSKGRVHYADRVNEVRVLKLKAAEMTRELAGMRRAAEGMDAVKRELHRLARELLNEKTKVKALSEELESPLNKIQTLQKRLIAKTEEVVEKDLVIQEKEKLYIELKSILARQPGPEIAEQLSVYQHSLREKTKQMKAMAAELNMHQAQRRKEQFHADGNPPVHNPVGGVQPMGLKPTQTRYTGGGFSLST
eukprot:jgi/Chlat1/1318/Chrsp118S01746